MHNEISITTWNVGYQVCFACFIMGGIPDCMIAFKYLKSAFGIVNRKMLGKINKLQWAMISVFLVTFWTSQIIIGHFLIHHEYDRNKLIAEILIGNFSAPRWMHAIFIFDLCLIIVFECIVMAVLIVALYLIRKFSQHSSDTYIAVTILMITLYYTTVCI